MILPWQTKQWRQLLTAQQLRRLPHAILLAGNNGLGKLQFANHFIHRLLCHQVKLNNQDCLSAKKKIMCHSCCLIKQHVHPNVLWIIEEESQAIKVDQIREIHQFAYQSSLNNDDYYIIVIHPAENMNVNSSNALLKTLEEPPPGCLFILISSQTSLLSATIRSRCQRISFSIPEKELALTWLNAQLANHSLSSTMPTDLLLAIANGAPLTALQLLQTNSLINRQHIFEALYSLQMKQDNLLEIALSLQNQDMMQFIAMVNSWLMDIVRLQLNVNSIINVDYKNQLMELAQRMRVSKNLTLLAYLQMLTKQITQGIHLNKQLLIEDVLIRYSDIR